MPRYNTLVSQKRQSKSAQWHRVQEQDTQVRAARAQGYRSRSAFKLLEIDARERLLHSDVQIADLGCSPGGWLQVATQKTDGKVVGVDLLPTKPVVGAHILQADFTQEKTIATILELFDGRADVVLSDMAPNLSGIAAADQARAAELVRAAMNFALRVLPPTGRFLSKGFQGDDFPLLLEEMKKQFMTVKILHLQASRAASKEAYFLARGVRKA